MEDLKMSDAYIENIDLTMAKPKMQRDGVYLSSGKRFLDIFCVLVFGPVAIPFILLIWVGAFLNGGSGFYAQPRVGRNGVIFNCWKIRTMSVDADEELAKMIEEDTEIANEWRSNQKLRKDPRITRFGQFLRASSIDELPQLWNILVGDMSFIGPRPFTPDQQALYDGAVSNAAYYLLRPGLSGLWQVQSRNVGNFKDRVQFDEKYAKSISFFSDLKIALWTVVVVFRVSGK